MPFDELLQGDFLGQEQPDMMVEIAGPLQTDAFKRPVATK